jgi:hypothetical protein
MLVGTTVVVGMLVWVGTEGALDMLVGTEVVVGMLVWVGTELGVGVLGGCCEALEAVLGLSLWKPLASSERAFMAFVLF